MKRARRVNMLPHNDKRQDGRTVTPGQHTTGSRGTRGQTPPNVEKTVLYSLRGASKTGELIPNADLLAN